MVSAKGSAGLGVKRPKNRIKVDLKIVEKIVSSQKKDTEIVGKEQKAEITVVD